MPHAGALDRFVPEGHVVEVRDRDETDAESVIDVVGVVGKTVGRIDDLSFE